MPPALPPAALRRLQVAALQLLVALRPPAALRPQQKNSTAVQFKRQRGIATQHVRDGCVFALFPPGDPGIAAPGLFIQENNVGQAGVRVCVGVFQR